MSPDRLAATLSAAAVLLTACAFADLDGSYVLPLDDWARLQPSRDFSPAGTARRNLWEAG